jgi:hypothetical protein
LINLFFTLNPPPDGKTYESAGVAGLCVSSSIGEVKVNSTVKADARFLRRIFLGMVVLTTVAGGLAAYTTVQAKTALEPGICLFFCE